VLENVSPVLTTKTTVLNVIKIELMMLQLVHVHTEPLKLTENAYLVTTDVMNVKTPKDTAQFVLKTELIHQPVIALMVPMKLKDKRSAQLVNHNV
jgi:hypothetical protein